MNNKLMTKCCLIIFPLMLFILTGCRQSSDLSVADLKVEYRQNPLGVDVNSPRFSWKIYTENRDVLQKSYRIILSEDPGDTRSGNGALWDTGKIDSEKAVNIEYEGESLKSNRKYFWRVMVWINDDDSVLSESAWFHTGILDKSDWQAEWITTPEEIIHSSPLLRKEFRVDKNIREAYAFISSCGFYEFYLNGKRVGDHVMDPGITDYRKTILYSTYDVTDFLEKGINAAGTILGNGAYNQRKVKDRFSWGREDIVLGNPAFFMQIHVKFNDGSESVIVTDDSWQYAWGPLTFNNLYGGEDYDARLEKADWNTTGFDDSDWNNTKISDPAGGKLKSQLMPAIKVTETIQPVNFINPSPGLYLFDLGQNIAGWWRVHMSGSSGRTVRISGAETLNDSLFSKSLSEGDKLSTKFPYHSQVWTDYTLKGDGLEVFEPRFFYTGYRYIEVSVSDGKNLDNLKVEGRVVGSALERNGFFESSDSLLNKIHRAGIWSQKGNTHSYPTDCPHREKGAYNGDGQVIAETSMHDFHMASFYTKWLNDMRDAQEENGRIPNTSPTLVGGMGGGVAWGSAYILIPWWMYNYYGDIRVLQEHYPTMKKYMQYLRNLARTDKIPEEDYIINDFLTYWFSLGEWCSPGRSDCPDHSVVNTFYFYYNSVLMSGIAGLLGYSNESDNFRSLSDTIREEFNKKFFNRETALYGTNETYQTYQLLALIGDVAPGDYHEKVLKTVIDDITDRDEHLNTGIIGTKYLWPVLVNAGYGDLAFRVAAQETYPGYGYWLSNGCTTFPEKWSGENSHNHQMFGSVVEYFYKYLGGIRSPMEEGTSPGYKNIYIKPEVPAGLNRVNTSIETVSGKILSNWEKSGNSFIHKVSVPANSVATVALPLTGSDNITVTEGDIKIWDSNTFIKGAEGVHNVEKAEGALEVKIGSGSYEFKISPAK
ncbi:MAG: family 78 glycoside hydrolase catalytic domain [Prolixibacteraceae bacterium]|nr:family 78 glycoside hydrolase catalytic domain [Prolixibacteraceae bacterium]